MRDSFSIVELTDASFISLVGSSLIHAFPSGSMADLIHETKNFLVGLIRSDALGKVDLRVSESSPDGDPQKFLLEGKPARFFYRFHGYYLNINDGWFQGSHELPSVNGGDFYWYVFAIGTDKRPKVDSYFICSYDQLRRWVLEARPEQRRYAVLSRRWVGDLQLQAGVFRWSTEEATRTDKLPPTRHIDVRNIVAAVLGDRKEPPPMISTQRPEAKVGRVRKRIFQVADLGESTGPGARQGHMLNPDLRKKIEQRAMVIARQHFEALGWQVRDVSKYKPFDYECIKGGEGLIVEVKGTTTRGEDVILTRNEVERMTKGYPNTALFVLHSITVQGPAPETVEGGVRRVIWPWKIAENRLVPIAFNYQLEA